MESSERFQPNFEAIRAAVDATEGYINNSVSIEQMNNALEAMEPQSSDDESEATRLTREVE